MFEIIFENELLKDLGYRIVWNEGHYLNLINTVTNETVDCCSFQWGEKVTFEDAKVHAGEYLARLLKGEENDT